MINLFGGANSTTTAIFLRPNVHVQIVKYAEITSVIGQDDKWRNATYQLIDFFRPNYLKVIFLFAMDSEKQARKGCYQLGDSLAKVHGPIA